MKKKRIAGTIIVKNNIVVQSFSFKKYLPLGKPEHFVENLDRWNIDEIIVLDIDSSKLNIGPNFELIKKIAKLKIRTPLIYGGGIRNLEEAKKVIQSGADRLVIGYSFLKDFSLPSKISNVIGAQAVILSLPLIKFQKEFFIYNYILKKNIQIKGEIMNYINSEYISELFITDVYNDGKFNGFKPNIIKDLKSLTKNFPLLVFGGISEVTQINKIAHFSNVASVCIGNFLNYHELNYQKYLKDLPKIKFRVSQFHK
jgi:imidazole glycerol-phosphate synthase subunit HisF